MNALHTCGVPADCDVCGRGLKAQMKYAGKIGAKYSLVLGGDELAAGKAQLKRMSDGTTREISIGGSFIEEYTAISAEQELGL